MKTIFLATTAVLFASSALAADMPSPPMAEQAVVQDSFYDWSGFYIGANVGYAFEGRIRTTDTSATETSGAGVFLPVGTFDAPDAEDEFDGWIGGGQVGYNRQVGNFVFGIEGDGQASDLSADATFTGPDIGAPTFENTVNIDAFGTVRGRVGYAFDNLMIYATGGLAIANVELGSTITTNGRVVGGILPIESDADSNIMLGYAVGAGVEYGISEGWSVKAEYLYVNLGEEDFEFAFTDTLTGNTTAEIDFHVARVGLNYRF